ncbi:putative oxidoreductase YcsN [Dissostichus eleginoides]|uniref:Oxidoreductase YcsN n=1 Tax=Dissostichus eleginoides TaxID=100907 RepID=A0AAD9FEG0_DISEL|nr:putative oxidoreductase YcsN [Dissostichus eleginoides]
MSPVPKVRLSGGLEICRVLNGMWQVSGAHGAVNNPKAVEAMQAYVDAGLTTFDMADIYGPAEDIFGQFNNQVQTQTHTDTHTTHTHHSTHRVPDSV